MSVIGARVAGIPVGEGVWVSGNDRISAGGFSKVAVGVMVGESVMVGVFVKWVGVRVGGTGVNVRVGIGVRVGVLVGVASEVLVIVGVFVKVGVKVSVIVAVFVFVGE